MEIVVRALSRRFAAAYWQSNARNATTMSWNSFNSWLPLSSKRHRCDVSHMNADPHWPRIWQHCALLFVTFHVADGTAIQRFMRSDLTSQRIHLKGRQIAHSQCYAVVAHSWFTHVVRKRLTYATRSPWNLRAQLLGFLRYQR
jgi:hypothetical protein